ncbi:MAG: DUF2059 domain-containing protein [Methylocystis sp.]|nr:DUF2059 domain-containing protein [Methylocystis sp.]
MDCSSVSPPLSSSPAATASERSAKQFNGPCPSAIVSAEQEETTIVLSLSRKVRCGLVGLALAAPPALAEQSAPATPAPSAAQLTLARDVVINSGIASSFQIIIPQFLDQIGVTLTRTRPELISDLNLVLANIKSEFDKKADDMIDTAARLYLQRLSEKELEDVSAFYKSPSGRKYVGSQPILMNDMFVAMQAWSQKISVDMMTRVREEMRKKGHEL